MKMAIENSKMFRLIKQGFTKEQIKMEGKYREGEIEEVFANLDTTIQKVLVLIDEKVPMSEIPNILGLSEYSFKNQLTCYTNRLSSLYNEDIARKIKAQEAQEKSEKLNALYVKLENLENSDVNLESIVSQAVIQKYRKFQTIKAGLTHFLLGDGTMSKKELASLCQIDKGELYRVLRGKDQQKIISYYFPDYKDVFIKYANTTIYSSNHPHITLSYGEEIEKSYMQLPSLIRDVNYVAMVALTYRLSLHSLCEYLHFNSPASLKAYLYKTCDSKYVRGLRYLFEEEKAFADFLYNVEETELTLSDKQIILDDKANFLKCKSDMAYLSKCQIKGHLNNDKYQEIYRKLTDYDYKKLCNKINKGKKNYTDDEVRTLVLHKIKYNVTTREMPVDIRTISTRCPYDLKEKLDSINAYNNARYDEVMKRRRKKNYHA